MAAQAAHPRRELEFEQALIDILQMDYDLRVRHEGGQVERRKSGYATLRFEYQNGATPSNPTRVIVRIAELAGFSCVFNADMSSLESAQRSAEACESLALAVIEVTEALALREAETGPRGRREED